MRKLDSEFVSLLAAAIRGRPVGQSTTWSDVVTLSAGLGVKCTRQWLCKNLVIAEAYDEVRRARRSDDGARLPETSLGRAQRQIARLRLDVSKRDEVIRAYDEKLLVILQAARAAGLKVNAIEMVQVDLKCSPD